MKIARLAIIATLLLTGCAGWREQIIAPEATVADERAARREAAVQSFEQHRDAMQIQAALARFEQGDYAGCQSRLATLVERRPDYIPARLRLAEILWSRGDAAAAEEHFRAVLALDADNAEAHHGLGTLLEESGRTAEAVEHLAVASETAADSTRGSSLLGDVHP
jgi:Tfp pilus assembly protein PilF